MCFFPMLNCKNWKKRVKTAQSRSKNKVILGFKKSWEWFCLPKYFQIFDFCSKRPILDFFLSMHAEALCNLIKLKLTIRKFSPKFISQFYPKQQQKHKQGCSAHLYEGQILKPKVFPLLHVGITSTMYFTTQSKVSKIDIRCEMYVLGVTK